MQHVHSILSFFGFFGLKYKNETNKKVKAKIKNYY